MGLMRKLRERIRQRGLRRVLKALWSRYVYFHWELLWMERDLSTPIKPQALRPYGPVTLATITTDNADAFARHFADRVEIMRELAADGHTGHMYLDNDGHAIAFIWGSTRDYFDRHYYGCTFTVAQGEFFAFCAEVVRPYFGTHLTVDGQLNLWDVMRAQGCHKVVDICESHNIQALKVHIRMGYHEQGRITHVHCLFGRWRLFRETRYDGSRLEPLRKPDRTAVTAPA